MRPAHWNLLNNQQSQEQHLQVTPGEMQTFTFYIQYNIHTHLHLHRYWTISIGTMLHSAAARWQNLMKWRRTSSEVPEVWHEKHVWQSENSNNEPCICKYTLMLQSLLQVVLEVFVLVPKHRTSQAICSTRDKRSTSINSGNKFVRISSFHKLFLTSINSGNKFVRISSFHKLFLDLHFVGIQVSKTPF